MKHITLEDFNRDFNLYSSPVPSMTSREIAKLTDKLHKNVLADIDKIISNLGTELKFELSEFIDPTGRKLREYKLDQRTTMLVVTGYSNNLRLLVIDQWLALRSQYDVNVNKWKRERSATKLDYFELKLAIKKWYAGTWKFYHESGAIDMINKVVLGMTAKQFKVKHGMDKDATLREVLSNKQLETIDHAQKTLAKLFDNGVWREKRLETIQNIYGDKQA